MTWHLPCLARQQVQGLRIPFCSVASGRFQPIAVSQKFQIKCSQSTSPVMEDFGSFKNVFSLSNSGLHWHLHSVWQWRNHHSAATAKPDQQATVCHAGELRCLRLSSCHSASLFDQRQRNTSWQKYPFEVEVYQWLALSLEAFWLTGVPPKRPQREEFVFRVRPIPWRRSF